MSRTRKDAGFALVLVLILVAVGVILGMSYVSSASLHMSASKNFRLLARARYLAESGLQHAMHVLRDDPSQLDGSVANPLGPYYVDGTSDAYTFSAEPVAGSPDRYTLTATGVVGNARDTASMTVRHGGDTIQVNHGLLVGGAVMELPEALTIHGDFHANGHLHNMAFINGDASATDGLVDPQGRITGTTNGSAAPAQVPSIDYTHYVSYTIDDTTYNAAPFTGDTLHINDPLARGGAVTEQNIGGVVYLTPDDGDTVTLSANLDFTGTLIIDGDILLGGQGIALTAVEGFPAIVASGALLVTRNARSVTINGVVVANEGVMVSGGDIKNSSTTINGALVCRERGYQVAMNGTHTLTYDQQRALLYDFGQTQAQAPVVILEWRD